MRSRSLLLACKQLEQNLYFFSQPSASFIFVSAGNTKLTEKWQIKTSNGSKIPAGWQPFGYDSNDQSDPFLIRHRNG